MHWEFSMVGFMLSSLHGLSHSSSRQPYDKNYDSLYFADEKTETSYLQGQKSIFSCWIQGTGSNHHAPLFTPVVEQAICIVAIWGPYFTLVHYIQWISPRASFPTGVKFLKTLEHTFRIFQSPLTASTWEREELRPLNSNVCPIQFVRCHGALVPPKGSTSFESLDVKS